MSHDEPIIRVEGLTKRFGDVPALKNISLTIPRGRIVGLVGANGGGKSTLLRTMVGLYLPDEGGCTTLGREAGKLRPEDLARIGYVHQEGQLVDWMTVDQIASGRPPLRSPLVLRCLEDARRGPTIGLEALHALG